MREQYTADGVVTGLVVLPEATARRMGRHILRRGEAVSSLVVALAQQPAVVSVLKAVLGPDVMVRNADVFIKPPGCEGRIDWHLDTAVPWPASQPMANLWVALTESGPRCGGVSYLPGWHRRALPEPPADREHLTLSPAARAALPVGEAICPTLRPGQATLHAFSTPHTSGANRSAAARVGVVLRCIASDIDPAIAECGQGLVVAGRASGLIGSREDFPIGWHTLR